MNKTGKERLLALANHLRHGKLGHKIFDFSVYNVGWPEEIIESLQHGEQVVRNFCGTTGCALGEMPILDPDNWRFDRFGYPELTKEDPCSGITQAARYFGLYRQWYARALFCPLFCLENFNEPVSEAEIETKHVVEFFKMKQLGSQATKEQVAENIETFVREYELNVAFLETVQ